MYSVLALPRVVVAGWVINVSEFAETLSVTCAGYHEHASLTHRTAEATEPHTPELVAAISKGIICHTRRCERIAKDALRVGIGPLVDEKRRGCQLANR